MIICKITVLVSWIKWRYLYFLKMTLKLFQTNKTLYVCDFCDFSVSIASTLLFKYIIRTTLLASAVLRDVIARPSRFGQAFWKGLDSKNYILFSTLCLFVLLVFARPIPFRGTPLVLVNGPRVWGHLDLDAHVPDRRLSHCVIKKRTAQEATISGSETEIC